MNDNLPASIIRAAFRLALFALLTAGAISLTWLLTKEPIAAAKAKLKEDRLLAIMGDEPFDNDLLQSLIIYSADGQPLESYAVKYHGQLKAIIMPITAPDGYNGNIELLVGLRVFDHDNSSEVIAVRALSHQETPGLGDKIDAGRSDWVYQFRHKSLLNTNWRLDQGGFDALTGATITSRAVVKAVHKRLLWYRENAEHIKQKLAISYNDRVGQHKAIEQPLR